MNLSHSEGLSSEKHFFGNELHFTVFPGIVIRREVNQSEDDPDTPIFSIDLLHLPPGAVVHYKDQGHSPAKERWVRDTEIKAIEVDGVMYEAYNDYWSNVFFARKVERQHNLEQKELYERQLQRAAQIWNLALHSDTRQDEVLKDSIPENTLRLWNDMLDYISEQPENFEIPQLSDSVDLKITAQSHQAAEVFLQYFKYNSPFQEKIKKIIDIFEAHQEPEGELYTIYQIFRNYRVLINIYSTLSGPYRISSFNKRFALANLAEHFLAEQVSHNAGERHERNYERVASLARELSLMHAADAFQKCIVTSMQFAFGAGNLVGKPYVALLFANTTPDSAAHLVDHERFHSVLSIAGAQRGEQTLGSNESYADFDCEEGFVDAASFLITASGDLQLALEMSRRDINAYTPAVEALLQILAELEEYTGDQALVIVLRAIEEYSQSKYRKPIDSLRQQYDAIPNTQQQRFLKKMAMYNDLQQGKKSISLSSRLERTENPEVFIPRRTLVDVEGLSYQDFLTWMNTQNEKVTSFDDEEAFLRNQQSLITQLEDGDAYILTTVRRFSALRRFFCSFLESEVYRDEIQETINNRYRKHILTLLSLAKK